MKKEITRLTILTIVLMIVSAFVILYFGRIYKVTFYTGDDNHETVLENETGEVEILEEKKEGDNYIVKVKAKKPGRVFLSLKFEDSQNTSLLYVHKSMIITDNTYFGKSTGSEVIPISLLIILSYIMYLLIKTYRYHVKENLYQYKNIAYLGIIIFLSFFILSTVQSLFNYQGLYETVNGVINSMSTVSFFLFPVALITSILVTISNIQLIRKEGMSLKNLLGLFLGLFICLATILPDRIYQYLMQAQTVNIFNLNGPGPYLYNFFESVLYLSVSYMECILVGTIVIAIKSIKHKPEYNQDYMIILGCQIREDGTLTPLLKGRTDKALQFRKEQLEETKKDLVFVPSGGKGSDEIISEAEAIKNYLLDNGIKEKNILVENKSKNTYQNIKFSNNIINDKNAKICFSTTNYHVLRAGLIATEQGLKIEGIGSKTKAYFWINAFIREFIGTLFAEKKKHITVVSLIIVNLIIVIGITYVANNI